MKFDPTKEQLDIINGDGDMLVSANAGTGKTTVMLNRILRLISEGASIDRMLLTTFTQAAASDIKNKLGSMLLAQSASRPEFLAEYNKLASVEISTMHAWCSRLIKKYFYISGDDPAYDIAVSNDVDMWKKQCISKATLDVIQDEQSFAHLSCYIPNKKLSEIEFYVRKLMEETLSRVDGEEYLQTCIDSYDSAEIRAEMTEIERRLQAQLRDKAYEFEMIATECNVKKLDIFMTAINANIAGHREIFPAGRGLKDASEVYSNLRDDFKELYKVRDILSSGADKAVQCAVREIVKITKIAIASYEKIKTNNGVLDFNDLERKAYAVLTSEVGDSVRSSYDYIFIDEYQDINPTQQSIINALKGYATMFYVGDIKQSIYAFRNCSPDAFLKSMQTMPRKELHMLSLNFRCISGVQHFANRVFARAMTEKFGSINYSEFGMFNKVKPELDGVSIVYYDDTKDEIEKSSFSQLYDIEEASSNCLARHSEQAEKTVNVICDLLSSEITVHDETRRARYSDIVVLIKSRNSASAELAKLLSEAGIPVSGGRSEKYTDEPLINDFISYLKLIDNRRDDISMLGCMHSYFGKFTDSELKQISELGGDFCYAVKRMSKGDGELSDKVRAFLSELDYFTALSQTASLYQLFGSITAHFDLFKYILGVSGGSGIANNLGKIIKDVVGLNCSISQWIARISEEKMSEELGEGDYVRIMTMHHSKGLEFPCVILYDICNPHGGNKDNNVIIDKKYGICLEAKELGNNNSTNTAMWYLAKKRAKKAEAEEKMRLLYVAMTRAICRMVVVLKDKSDDKLCEPCDASTLGDWILPIAKKWGQQIINVRADKLDSCCGGTEQLTFVPEFCPPLPAVPIKTTATERAHEAYTDEMPIAVHYSEKSGLSGEDAIKKGNAYHKALELYDYLGASGQLDEVLEVVPNSEFIERAKLEKIIDIICKSSKGGKVYSEFPFLYQVEVDGETKMLQGIIDVIIVKGDECVIFDYKTGKITEQKLVTYGEQLRIYKNAVECLTNLKVTHTAVLGIDEGKEYIVE